MADAVLRGRVTRVSGGALYVVVPRLGSGVEFGPLTYTRQRVDGGWSDAPEAGDRVIVGVIEDCPDDLIVLGVQS